MNETIVNEELVAEFVKKSKDPIAELQFKGGVSYGTAFAFIKTKKAPKREKTMKGLALAIGVDIVELFKVSNQAAS